MSPNRANSSGSHDRSAHFPDPAHDASGDREQKGPRHSIRKRSNGILSQQEVDPKSSPDQTPDGSPNLTGYEQRLRKRDTAVPSKKNRISSGFLLDHAGLHHRLASLSRRKNDGRKGKAKPYGGGSGLGTANGIGHRSPLSSIGSSPLATKVSTLEDAQNSPMVSSALDGQDSSRSRVSSGSRRNSNTLGDEARVSNQSAEPAYTGYDTDPTQIVNLALSLNEGRRRQVSGMRFASGNSGIRPSITAGRHSDLASSRRQSSLPQHLHFRDHPSQYVSTEKQVREQSVLSSASDQSRGISGSYLQPSAVQAIEPAIVGELTDVSHATLARAQKAKDHFELSYEHRRLLPHLPPLRGPIETSQTHYSEGRAYNPLQCARNRKLRFSEKKTAVGDTEGWDDVQQVHNWINSIIEGHTEPRNDPDQCIRLPAPDHLHTDADQGKKDPTETPSPISSLRKRNANSNKKHRRHRSDWAVSPENLLADVYWLEQGLNKTKVEDRDGSRIYPWDTAFKYTGWRSGTPAHDQGQRPPSTPPHRTGIGKPKSIPTVSPLELPDFVSTGRRGKQRGRERRRGARMERIFDSEKSGSESRTRRKRPKKNFIRSPSRSSTSESGQSENDSDIDSARDTAEGTGGKERIDSATESSGLNYYVRKTLDDEARRVPLPVASSKPGEFTGEPQPPVSSRIAESSRGSFSRERVSPNKYRGSDHLPESLRRNFHKKRQSGLSLDTEQAVRSSLDYDSTAESSPSIPQFPGIATNLSPPATRSPSPTKIALHPVGDRGHNRSRMGIDAADFVDTPSSPTSYYRDSETARQADGLSNESRDMGPSTKAARRSSDPVGAPEKHPQTHNITTKASGKPPNSLDTMTRIRGIFKGGRIGELVGNEMSRVGEFVWRRESPAGQSKAGFLPSAESNHGSERGDARANSRRRESSPSRAGRTYPAIEHSSRNAVPAQLRPTLREKPSYSMNNFPTFTSPFQKDREARDDRHRAALSTWQSCPQDTPGAGQFSGAVSHLRSSSRSSRVGPHNLNASPGSSSPPASSEDRRRRPQNHEPGKPTSAVDAVNASKVLSKVISHEETSIGKLKRRSEPKQNWDLSLARKVSAEEASKAVVSQKDIALTQALLHFSRIKAHQISYFANTKTTQRHHHDHHDHQHFLFLLSNLSPPTLTAQSHIKTLSHRSDHLRSTLDTFTKTTIPTLHHTLSNISSDFSTNLTPHVLSLADSNAELGVKLTTTSTLAVQELNERIEAALRRKRRGRRGPLKWSRRLGYLLVEWIVVGLLWGIWFVVFVVRFVAGVGTGLARAGRWLLWLE